MKAGIFNDFIVLFPRWLCSGCGDRLGHAARLRFTSTCPSLSVKKTHKHTGNECLSHNHAANGERVAIDSSVNAHSLRFKAYKQALSRP